MRIIGRLALVSALALFVAACSDDSGTSDGKVPMETGPQPDQGPPPTELVCNNDCEDFVFSKITLPDTNTATQIGHDYDGDGSKDNALGAILGGLSQMAGSLNIQEAVDGGVNSGSTLLLLRMQADDFANDTSSKAQAWVGAKMECCTDSSNATACAAEAQTKCFGGSTEFFLDSTSPKDALFGGRITSSKMVYGPAKLKFLIPFTGAGSLELNLMAVYLEGEVAADGKSIKKGVLAGAISQADLNGSLIPKIVDMLNNTLTTSTDPQTKSTIKLLFDPDDNDVITKDEVTNSTMVKAFLSGDVDVDKDGTKELSLGVAFEAVSGTINDKGTQPDMGPTPDMAPVDAGPTPDMAPVDAGPTPDAPAVDM